MANSFQTLRLLLAFQMIMVAVPAAASDYTIGVYYWPGWQPLLSSKPSSWTKIRPYSEREPLLGWYPEGQQAIMDQQLVWMKRYGLSFVVFSHVYNAAGHPDFPHAVDAYMKSPERQSIQFAVQWANHNPIPRSEIEFYNVINGVIGEYFYRPEYFKIDGKPVFFIWSGVWLELNTRKFKGSVQSMIARAQEIARSKGLPGIYFVAGEAIQPEWIKILNGQGYGAISAYNHHNAPASVGQRYSHSYDELDAGYRENWERVASLAQMTYIMPMTVGWDRRPWGGTKNDPLHDESSSSVGQFRTHLTAGRAFIDAHRDLTQGLGVICCWNEYGEGGYIEPTKAEGFQRLEAIHDVFGLASKN